PDVLVNRAFGQVEQPPDRPLVLALRRQLQALALTRAELRRAERTRPPELILAHCLVEVPGQQADGVIAAGIEPPGIRNYGARGAEGAARRRGVQREREAVGHAELGG